MKRVNIIVKCCSVVNSTFAVVAEAVYRDGIQQVDRKYSHLNAFAMWHILCHFIGLNTFMRARYAIACINFARLWPMKVMASFTLDIRFSMQNVWTVCVLCVFFFAFIQNLHAFDSEKWLVCLNLFHINESYQSVYFSKARFPRLLLPLSYHYFARAFGWVSGIMRWTKEAEDDEHANLFDIEFGHR